MKRAVVLLGLMAVALAGCSGKAAAPTAPALTTAQAGPSKPNPWARDSAATPVAAAAKPAPAAKATTSPWAKDGAAPMAPAG